MCDLKRDLGRDWTLGRRARDSRSERRELINRKSEMLVDPAPGPPPFWIRARAGLCCRGDRADAVSPASLSLSTRNNRAR